MGSLSQAEHRRLDVRAEEDVGAARRVVARMAGRLPARAVSEAELAVTELTVNLVRHAGGGYVLCRQSWGGMELISVDHGPGIPVGVLAATGTPGASGSRRGDSLGLGLAAVGRLSEVFDCYSGPAGTVVLARLRGCAPSSDRAFAWGAVNVPLGGSGESGDSWAVAADGRLAVLVVDGLGHGPDASAAAQAAVSAFSGRPGGGPESVILRAHEAMRGTRGGVLAVCTIDPDSGELTYAGIGNISGRLLRDAASQGLVSHDGTAGTQLALPRARTTVLRWSPDTTLILASDGIDRHWDPRAYPGLLRHDPAVIAATLHRDHGRGTDDAMMLVVRGHGGDPG